jgi:hypothetical protein
MRVAEAPHGANPLWLVSPPSSGRWQHGETVAAIYLADEESTVWAEWYPFQAAGLSGYSK